MALAGRNSGANKAIITHLTLRHKRKSLRMSFCRAVFG